MIYADILHTLAAADCTTDGADMLTEPTRSVSFDGQLTTAPNEDDQKADDNQKKDRHHNRYNDAHT